MVTHLIALRLAANLEAQCIHIQEDLFRQLRLTSARLLPPVIPLLWSATAIPHAELERARHRHPVHLAGHTVVGTTIALHGATRIRATGLRALVESIEAAASAIPRSAAPAVAASVAESAADASANNLPARMWSPALIGHDEGELRFAWSYPPAEAAATASIRSVELPPTGALWLSHMTIETGSDGGRWDEWWKRRLRSPQQKTRTATSNR